MIPFNKWKYKNSKNSFVYLENWMKLSMELANYIKQANQPIKIYVYVPSSLTFSYFFTLGAIDHDFRNLSVKTVVDKYLNLKKGQRILYKTGDDWIAHSVIKVSKIPNSKIRAIMAKDRLNSTIYIPEKRWFEYVRIHDDEVTKVRNIRRVANVEDLTDNDKLKSLYSEDSLNLLMMQNTPKTYLNANKKEWKENVSIIDLEKDGQPVRLDELLYDGTSGVFKNISFIERNYNSVLPDESTLVFVGSSRSRDKMDQFKQYKCVFISDQHDSDEKVEELRLKIEQNFLMGESQCFNKDILEYLDNNQVEIPKGVEVFAWLSKS